MEVIIMSAAALAGLYLMRLAIVEFLTSKEGGE